MEYPEHKKLEQFSHEQRMAIFEFIEFMEGKGFGLFDINAPYNVKSFAEVFYQMLGIDKDKLDQEKDYMLKQFRNKAY